MQTLALAGRGRQPVLRRGHRAFAVAVYLLGKQHCEDAVTSKPLRSWPWPAGRLRGSNPDEAATLLLAPGVSRTIRHLDFCTFGRPGPAGDWYGS
jgi:hypothetical protein